MVVKPEKTFFDEKHTVEVHLLKGASQDRYLKIRKDNIFVIYSFRNDQNNMTQILETNEMSDYLELFEAHNHGEYSMISELGQTYMLNMN